MILQQFKIAVFAKQSDFNQMRLKPKSKFVNIKTVEDVHNHEFDGVITIGNTWHYDSEKDYAYQRLIQNHPKLKP